MIDKKKWHIYFKIAFFNSTLLINIIRKKLNKIYFKKKKIIKFFYFIKF
jgi:hypothetical protein